MKNHHKRRGIFAAAGALLTAAALALGGAVAAQAAPTIPDANAQASLSITKLKTPDAGTPQAGDGSAVTSLPSAGLNGVEFTIWKLDPNLATNAGWQAAAGYTLDPKSFVVKDQNGAEVTLGAATQTGTTKNDGTQDGVLNFSGLAIGLYLVKETVTPAGVNPAIPFLVTLPMTDPANQQNWMYNVHVYPKNSQVGITKVVNDTAAWDKGSDNHVVWTIDADVPRILNQSATPKWTQPSKFTVTDTLVANLALTNVQVSAVDSVGNEIANALDAGDYTVTPAPITGTGVTVTVDFTPAGLAKLQGLADTNGAKIRVVVTTQGTGDDLGDGEKSAARIIANGASVVIGADGNETSISVKDSDQPTTRWANIAFTKWLKHKDNTTNTKLAGATFQLFKTKSDADKNQHPLTTQATSDTSGSVALNGVRVSDWQNGVSVQEADYRIYWLTETQAPATAELLAESIPVVVLSDGTVRQATVDSAGKVSAVSSEALGDVVNVEKNGGFQLPLTGGTGTLALTLGGIAILAIVLLVARRRRSSETHAG